MNTVKLSIHIKSLSGKGYGDREPAWESSYVDLRDVIAMADNSGGGQSWKLFMRGGGEIDCHGSNEITSFSQLRNALEIVKKG